MRLRVQLFRFMIYIGKIQDHDAQPNASSNKHRLHEFDCSMYCISGHSTQAPNLIFKQNFPLTPLTPPSQWTFTQNTRRRLWRTETRFWHPEYESYWLAYEASYSTSSRTPVAVPERSLVSNSRSALTTYLTLRCTRASLVWLGFWQRTAMFFSSSGVCGCTLSRNS